LYSVFAHHYYSIRPRKFIIIFIILAGILSIFDQSRWQPWFYQYLFMFTALGFYSWSSNDVQKQNTILHTCRFIVASIYFWSGLQKINANFIIDIFPWLADPLIWFLPESIKIFPHSFGVAAPFIEVGIGIGLLTKKYRNISIILAIVMHGLILLSIGPLGHNWNSVVWPWNIAMATFVVTLFLKTDDIPFKKIVWTDNFAFQKIVLVLFGAMPLFSFFNLWDSYLSSALYSGNTDRALIYMSDPVRNKLPSKIQNYTYTTNSHEIALDISRWSFGELNVPPYPEERVYKTIAKNICTYADSNSDITLVVQKRVGLLNGARKQQIYTCSNL